MFLLILYGWVVHKSATWANFTWECCTVLLAFVLSTFLWQLHQLLFQNTQWLWQLHQLPDDYDNDWGEWEGSCQRRGVIQVQFTLLSSTFLSGTHQSLFQNSWHLVVKLTPVSDDHVRCFQGLNYLENWANTKTNCLWLTCLLVTW